MHSVKHVSLGEARAGSPKTSHLSWFEPRMFDLAACSVFSANAPEAQGPPNLPQGAPVSHGPKIRDRALGGGAGGDEGGGLPSLAGGGSHHRHHQAHEKMSTARERIGVEGGGLGKGGWAGVGQGVLF